MHEPLRRRQRAPRPLRQTGGERFRLGVHVGVGDDLGDEAPVECLVGAEHAVRERELERAADADEAGHEPARRAVGGEPDARVRHHELRGLPRDDEVRRADEAQPRSCRAAVDRGHHRSVAPHEQRDRGVQRGDEPADVGGELVAERRERLHVTAPAEPRAVARQEHHADTVVEADRGGGGQEVLGQAVVDAVGGLGAVQREVGDPVAHLEQHVVTSHGTGCYEHRPIPVADTRGGAVPPQEEIPPASAGGISKGPCISETFEITPGGRRGPFPPARCVRAAGADPGAVGRGAC